MEFFFKEWPLWLINLGLIATLLSTFLTFVIYFRTRFLSSKFNDKASSDYIVSSVGAVYKSFTQEIQTHKENDINSNGDVKYIFWKLIHECNACVSVYKKNDKDMYLHIGNFKKEVKKLEALIKSKDALTYAVTWDYYQFLVALHVAIKSEHDMRTRKV